ncbi:FAD-dependent pyridine nucleotide-disulfide oxidoreductase [Sulfurifustis variabilis]|uniref:FAD-dependent pyridine nucleotide-disulfide oxidoreductase n=1 Tax=Sulfurifustis variabilis TaxID=1675686 RepID=A0A1C7AFP2_9GAMM|nr:FAD/NAD(P)-binding oxidoreductase [Sulfurifustis variabilis]BAU50188.1 FAD-dependent pyridine nucleotide-disulfide oxidoreductase [Sulfurifustis variabilis]
MERYQYIIVGGGMTADAAAKGIREVDPQGTIAIFAAERHPPYNRPPLTKGLWKGKAVETVWRGTAETGATLRLDRTIAAIDPERKVVQDRDGETHGYEKLLLATGGAPRRLPGAGEGVIYFRTLDDYLALRDAAGQRDEFAVIGGGFIGSEIAAALAMNGKRVTLVFPDAGIGGRVYPGRLSQFVNDYYRARGVTVLSGESVRDVRQPRPGRFVVSLESGRTVEADGVVAGLGIEPNVGLAEAAGLKVGNGVEVDEYCRTSSPDIHAAGDVASFHNAALGVRLRVEHQDNADTMGRTAGRNMAGAGERYDHLPFFYSDLFDLGYEAVGETDSRYDIVEDWKDPFRKGVVYYLRDGRVRGVLLWNTWGQVDAARRLIASGESIETTTQLKGRIKDQG